MSWLRVFISLYLLFSLFVSIIWRGLVFRKQTGKNPFILGDSETPAGYLATWLKKLSFVVAVEVLTFSFYPDFFSSGPLMNLPIPAYLTYFGVLLLLLALSVIVLAQIQMGESWRVGFATDEKTEIVCRGLYKYSRNPIYFGLLLTQIGFLLVLPNFVSLLVMLIDIVLLQITIRLEEAHLTALHGEPYLEFKRRVRRWI